MVEGERSFEVVVWRFETGLVERFAHIDAFNVADSVEHKDQAYNSD